MKVFRNIMFANIDWAEEYRGEKPKVNYRGLGWERFNFLLGPTPSKCFYGNARGIGPTNSAPMKRPKSGWLVIFCSTPPNTKGLQPVGWYKDAILEHAKTKRPKHGSLPSPMKRLWNQIGYTISAKNAHLIPVKKRKLSLAIPKHFRSVLYASVNGVDRYPELTDLANKIVTIAPLSSLSRTP